MAARVGISGDGALASFSQEVLKVTETHQTKHHSQLWICQSTVHIPRMYFSRESSSKEKENFISDVEGTRFGRRVDWDRAGNVCCFWRKVKFSECVPSPPSEPTMIIVGVWVWALHRESKSAVKQCLFRLSPKLLNATLLKPWYLIYTREDFMLTSSQKMFSACFSSFLAFRTSCAEEWCNLSEDGRQKMCKAMMAHHHWKIKRYIFSFHHCFPGFKDLL